MAPDFTLTADDGTQVSLSDYRGPKVIVYFYPKADTPGCTKQACALRDVYGSIDAQGASVMGISPDLVVALVFFLAGASAGLGGVLFGIKYTVWPQMGVLTLKAFIAAVVGGLGSLPGAVLGAVILGVTETFAAAFVSSAFRDLFSYALMIIIILIKPAGLPLPAPKLTNDCSAASRLSILLSLASTTCSSSFARPRQRSR